MANMASKLIRVWLLTLTILLFSSISIYAYGNVQGDFFIKNIIVNGDRIENYNLQYSFVLYNDTMYIPLTPEIREILGVELVMDKESRTLNLLRVESTRRNISENWMKNDANPLALNVIPDARVIALTLMRDHTDDVINVTDDPEHYTDEVRTILPFVAEVELNGMPLLEKDGHIFIPLRAIANNEVFNWDIFYDSFFGVCISTDSNVPAKTYFDREVSLENRGLVSYITRHNRAVGETYGIQLVFLFRRAGEVFGINSRLLIALAHRESTFNAAAVSRAGAIGMMQVMPATGARFGVTAAQLFDTKTSIDFGAMYLGQRLATFEGDWIKALSAYNQGARAVQQGRHSTTFAERVIATYHGIDYFLRTHGYVIVSEVPAVTYSYENHHSYEHYFSYEHYSLYEYYSFQEYHY